MKNANKILSLVLAVVMIFGLIVPISAATPDDTAMLSDHTYKRIDQSMTWTEAKAYCENLGGYLATITTPEEQYVIQALVEKGTKDQYWLGGTDEEETGNWKWVSGETWSYWHFTVSFDNFMGVEHYLQMQRIGKNSETNLLGYWNDANNENLIEGEEYYFSTEHIGFICEFGTSELVYEAEDTATYLDHTYKRFDMSMTWKEAKEYCESIGGYLATITSSQEQAVLEGLVKIGLKSQYWLGATDEERENNWKWITGEEMCYWHETITFNNFNDEDYLQMQRHNWGNAGALGYWNDANNENFIPGEESFYSTTQVGFICEFGTSKLPEEDNRKEPIIYIIGRTGIFTADGQPTIEEDPSFITNIVTQNSDALKDAILKGKWDEYCDAIYEPIAERYSTYRLNNEGEVENGTHNLWTWNEDTLSTRQRDIFTYRFEYDARLDPWDIADDLHEYIEAVKRVTGFDSVHLISRCLGCNIASAYIEKFGYEGIDTEILFASAAKGYNFAGEMFAGKFKFNSAAISRYADEMLYIENDEVTELVKATIEMSDEMGLTGAGTLSAEMIFKKVYKNIVPRLLKATYATCPGYWAMVNDENYEAAKKFIFGKEAKTTYKTLVNKIDNYHYNVQQNVEKRLKEMKKSGVKINVICKYGFQAFPFIKSSDQVGDNRIEVLKQSFGATTTKINETFSKAYLLKAKIKRTDKYISPDKQIDSSTALFPDSTWYIKNVEHNPFHDCFNPLMIEMCYSEKQMTVNSDSNWPQYLFYDRENSTCVPLTKKNMNTIDYTTNLLQAIIRYFKAAVKYLKWKLKPENIFN